MAAFSAARPKSKPKVTIVGAGNAAQALAALLPSRGFVTSFYCPCMYEAERLSAGIDAQGFLMATSSCMLSSLAKIASHGRRLPAKYRIRLDIHVHTLFHLVQPPTTFRLPTR